MSSKEMEGRLRRRRRKGGIPPGAVARASGCPAACAAHANVYQEAMERATSADEKSYSWQIFVDMAYRAEIVHQSALKVSHELISTAFLQIK
jgi:hypothetical protein